MIDDLAESLPPPDLADPLAEFLGISYKDGRPYTIVLDSHRAFSGTPRFDDPDPATVVDSTASYLGMKSGDVTASGVQGTVPVTFTLYEMMSSPRE